MKIVQNFSRFFITFMVALSFSTCTEDDAKVPKVVAGFTYTVTESGTVTFLNTSSKATEYAWDLGDGTTSTEINPIKSYPAGTFFVSLTASNVAGASDIFKDTIIIIKDQVSLPITFDNPNVDYKVTTFEGATFAIANNPNVSGTNNKATKVGALTNSGVASEGMFIDLENQIDLATNKTITMNFLATAPVSILLKLEEGTSGPIETSVNHGGTGWEKLSFNFTSSAKYSRLTLLVDATGTTKGTFYMDDIMQEGTVIPCVAETSQSLNASDFNLTHQTDPSASIISDNAGYAWVSNPSPDNSVNSSCKVGQVSRTSASAFANNQINLNAKLDFNVNSGFKVKVYSDVPGFKLTLKLEDKANAATNTELEVASTKTNEWEELTFPFASSQSNKYDKIILFFDLNTTKQAIYYFDDLKLYGSGGGPVCTPETTENINPATGDINWTFKTNDVAHTFEAFGNTSGAIVSNPVINGINSSCNVEKFTKTSGCQTFAGLGTTLSTALDFAVITKKVFKMKVLAETQVTQVTLRLERLPFPDTEPSQDRVASITQVGVWQELTFDFSDVTSGTFKSMIIYFERNANCDGDVYYFDDIIQVAGSAPTCTPEATENINPATGDINWTFKTNALTHTFEAFGNTAGAIVSNPVINGINPSCNVEKFTKTNGCETWSGLGTSLATALDFAVITKKAFKMKVLAETQVTQVTLRLERLPFPDTEPSQDRVASITQVGVWQELTFDFSDVTTGTFKSMIIYFERNAGCDGDVYYFDDIIQVTGSAPTCTPEATENINPATGDINWTFKTNAPTHTFEAFGNTAGVIVSNPVFNGINNSCNVEKFTKTNGCETWSGLGTTLATALDFAVITKKVFKMKVLAETQVTQVTLRLERLPFPDTEPSQDRVASITQVGVWQELTFDFSDVTTGTYKSMIIYFERNAGCDGDVYYFDDIIQVAGTGGGGCPAPPAGDLVSNGGFETGTTVCWTSFAAANNGTFEATNTQAKTGTYSGLLVANVPGGGGPASFPVVKAANIGVGTITPNKSVTITFDLYGSVAGAGGVVFAEFFSELSGGGTSSAVILGGGPLFPTNTWTSYSFTTTTGNDVSGGVTVQLKADCGANPGCRVEAFFDNVSVKIN